MTRLRSALWAAAALTAAVPASAKDITVPKGTYLDLKTETAFDNDTAKKGDTFSAKVTHGLWVEGQPAIPAGSTVTGTIKSVRSGRDGAKSGAVGVKFESLYIGGQAYPIGGVLVSLKADERKRILEQQGKIATGRKVDVILIGEGTEANMKVNTLVGISGADTDDLADEWSRSGLGPAAVRVMEGTNLTMEFDKALTLPGGGTAPRAEGDRNIYTSSETVRSVQRALRGRNYYTGDINGNLDQATRDALARFQLDQRQSATGDADEMTVEALGVSATRTSSGR